MVLKIFGIYTSLTILVFLKNIYRKYHVNYLRNKYRENLFNNQSAKNYELLIPLEKIFKHANIRYSSSEIEDCIIRGYHLYDFENSLEKAFYYYSYLAKHCYSWLSRISVSKIEMIKRNIPNKFLQVFTFILTALCDYMICLFLDTYNLGDKLLNILSSVLKSVF